MPKDLYTHISMVQYRFTVQNDDLIEFDDFDSLKDGKVVNDVEMTNAADFEFDEKDLENTFTDSQDDLADPYYEKSSGVSGEPSSLNTTGLWNHTLSNS